MLSTSVSEWSMVEFLVEQAFLARRGLIVHTSYHVVCSRSSPDVPSGNQSRSAPKAAPDWRHACRLARLSLRKAPPREPSARNDQKHRSHDAAKRPVVWRSSARSATRAERTSQVCISILPWRGVAVVGGGSGVTRRWRLAAVRPDLAVVRVGTCGRHARIRAAL